MSVPEWADEQLSGDLPTLRAKGESQDLEFMREFPRQASELAKEIAAFATSNTGTILIGVDDSGDIAGLSGIDCAEARDKLLQRLEGVCSGIIKPAVTPRAVWAVEDGEVVLAVTVPKGSDPIYYSQGKPYVRHLTTARPADPHEVIECIAQHMRSQLQPTDTRQEGESHFYSELAAELHNVLLWSQTPARERHVNPWLSEWKADSASGAVSLRELAASDVATEHDLASRIREVASALDEIVNFRVSIGCGPELTALAKRAEGHAAALKKDVIDTSPLDAASTEQVRSLIGGYARKLADLSRRGRSMANDGNLERLQDEVGLMGRELALLSYYDLSPVDECLSSKLHSLGMKLRLIGTRRIYMDGGASVRAIVDDVIGCAAALEEIAGRISN